MTHRACATARRPHPRHQPAVLPQGPGSPCCAHPHPAWDVEGGSGFIACCRSLPSYSISYLPSPRPHKLCGPGEGMDELRSQVLSGQQGFPEMLEGYVYGTVWTDLTCTFLSRIAWWHQYAKPQVPRLGPSILVPPGKAKSVISQARTDVRWPHAQSCISQKAEQDTRSAIAVTRRQQPRCVCVPPCASCSDTHFMMKR